jgi:hypothetical protein
MIAQDMIGCLVEFLVAGVTNLGFAGASFPNRPLEKLQHARLLGIRQPLEFFNDFGCAHAITLLESHFSSKAG